MIECPHGAVDWGCLHGYPCPCGAPKGPVCAFCERSREECRDSGGVDCLRRLAARLRAALAEMTRERYAWRAAAILACGGGDRFGPRTPDEVSVFIDERKMMDEAVTSECARRVLSAKTVTAIRSWAFSVRKRLDWEDEDNTALAELDAKHPPEDSASSIA